MSKARLATFARGTSCPGILLAALLAACGGRTDNPTAEGGTGAAVPARAPADAPAQAPAPSAPESMASDVGAPSAMVLDGDLVVFTTRTSRIGTELVAAGGLFVVDKRVPPALMIDVDRRGATFDALVTDGTSAFVATSDGRIVRVPLAGGDEATVASLDAPAVAMAASGDYVYFARDSGAVSRVAKTGGTPEDLAQVGGSVRGLVADDASVYVALAPASGDGAIVRISLATKATTPLATAPGQPCAVVRDATRLFWTSAQADATAAAGAVLRVSTDGADRATVAQGSFAACALAADTSSLYFATTTPSAMGAMAVRSNGSAAGLGLMRAPIAGGDPVAVPEATGALAQPGAVAVDATHLYWLTGSAVMRLRK
jgi:hypothetical protein